MADVSVVDDRAHSRFVLLVDGEVAGRAEYRSRPGSTSFTHTVVEPGHQGRGLAAVLVRRALDQTREQGRTVLPYCPYVREYIARHLETYLDLVPPDRRQDFGLPPA